MVWSNHLIMLRIRDSMGQEFDLDTEGTAVSSPCCLRPPLGRLKRLGLESPGSFFTYMTGSWCWFLTWAVDQSIYLWALLAGCSLEPPHSAQLNSKWRPKREARKYTACLHSSLKSQSHCILPLYSLGWGPYKGPGRFKGKNSMGGVLRPFVGGGCGRVMLWTSLEKMCATTFNI